MFSLCFPFTRHFAALRLKRWLWLWAFIVLLSLCGYTVLLMDSRVASIETQDSLLLNNMALHTFLHGLRPRLIESTNRTIFHIVLGNAACDLDSISGSLLHAMGLNYQQQQQQQQEKMEDVQYIPLLQIPLEDFPLRMEATYLFRKLGLDPQLLIFNNTHSDILNLHALRDEGRLRISLIDHNVLEGSLHDLGDTVIEVMDHHVDEQYYMNAHVRMIENVGSCCSLVADILLDTYPECITPIVCELLLSTILLDTINMDITKGRGTSKDMLIMEKLQEACGVKLHSDTLFRDINAAKFNVGSLSTSQLLRKDYKERTYHQDVRVGIAAVGLSIDDFTASSRGDVVADIISFRTMHKLDVLLVMLSFFLNDGSFHRELLISRGPNAQLVNSLADVLAIIPELSLEQVLLRDEHFNSELFAYKQHISKSSRKVVIPLLGKYFDKTNKGYIE